MRHILSLRCDLCGSLIQKVQKRPIKICSSCTSNPPDEHRCKATTVAGKRCKRWAVWEEDRCPMHKKRSGKNGK